MSDHTYQPGQLVERISTGERAQFHRVEETSDGNFIAVKHSCGLAEIMGGVSLPSWWPASDCRPAVDHAERCPHADAKDGTCSHPKNMTPECHPTACPIDSPFAKISEMNIDHAAEMEAKDAEIAKLEAQVAAAAERESKLRKLCGEAARMFCEDELKCVMNCNECKETKTGVFLDTLRKTSGE